MTDSPGGLCFKLASDPWEFDEIHRLNYATFVEEIPQHAPNSNHRLVDRFHEENDYIIAIRDGRLVGMLSIRDQRPFSLDQKLTDIEQYLPPFEKPCEVRLLSTDSGSRNGVIFRGLINSLAEYCLSRDYDLMLISGTVRQAKLYRHLGFEPFGPLVGTEDALYQPMFITKEAFRRNSVAFSVFRMFDRRDSGQPLSFLPGPVAVRETVRRALQLPAISHRSAEFLTRFDLVREKLCQLTGAKYVQVMMGSGSLANDAVAAQISTWNSPGWILVNGAFGQRLVDHARRFGLHFDTLEIPWGESFRQEQIELAVDRSPDAGWIWAVHGETSTGVLNDLAMLKSIAHLRGMRLAIDAVSSLGTVPIDLNDVALASSVSGKGLAAFSGLALVFHNDRLESQDLQLPRYLDLGFYDASGGVPFTLSSNLLSALDAALDEVNDRRFRRVNRLSGRLREALEKLGYDLLAQAEIFPAVLTISLPSQWNSVEFGGRLDAAGFQLHYRSDYLRQRNWIQICLMGDCDAAMTDELLRALQLIVRR